MANGGTDGRDRTANGGTDGRDRTANGGTDGRDRTTTRGPNGGAEASLVYIVGRVNQGIRRAMRASLAGLDLSVPEYTALSVLNARPGLSNAQLARRSLLAPQSMLEVLAKLESRGLVRREVDPGHGRILRAALTADGRDLLRRADPAINAIQEWLLADVPERERAVVLDGMRSAMQKLSDRSG